MNDTSSMNATEQPAEAPGAPLALHAWWQSQGEPLFDRCGGAIAFVVLAATFLAMLAWTWLRYQPDSALSIWFRERVGNLKGRIRRITIVAMARKLLIALWRYLETGVLPTGAVLKV